MTLKPHFKHLCICLLLVLSITGCKKDALKITSEKTYAQPTVGVAHDPYIGGMSLTLKPGGSANFNPGGDIVYSGTYDISGKKITVKVAQNQTTYKFSIISDDEIHGPDGEVLLLIKQ